MEICKLHKMAVYMLMMVKVLLRHCKHICIRFILYSYSISIYLFVQTSFCFYIIKRGTYYFLPSLNFLVLSFEKEWTKEVSFLEIKLFKRCGGHRNPYQLKNAKKSGGTVFCIYHLG